LFAGLNLNTIVQTKRQTNTYFVDDVLKTCGIKYSNVETQFLVAPLQWRSGAKFRPGPTIKVPPFQPPNFLTRIKNERRSCFVLIKGTRNNKAT